MATKFPEYKYGGKKSDYEIAYRDNNSGKFFKSLPEARKSAIRYEYNYLKANGYTHHHQVCYIEAYCFYKYKPGTDITYRQQSGKPKTIGYVLIDNVFKDDHSDMILWKDMVNKANSRVINKDGKVVRKLTKDERAWF